MGQPSTINIVLPLRKERGEPGEVNHLSTRRKRNRRDFRSSGERTGNSLNRKDVKGQVRCLYGVVGAD